MSGFESHQKKLQKFKAREGQRDPKVDMCVKFLVAFIRDLTCSQILKSFFSIINELRFLRTLFSFFYYHPQSPNEY